MMMGRPVKVVNSHRAGRAKPRQPSTARRAPAPNRPKHAPRKNPIYHLLTLGPLNPKKTRRSAVASKARPKRKSGQSAAARNHKKKSVAKRNSPTFVMMPQKNRKKGKRNPVFFGTSVSPAKMAMLVGGGLVGVAVNRMVLPMLPATVTGNNIAATAAAVAIAAAEWWAFSFLDKEFGAAAGFGGLMNAGSQALNAFIPSVGSVVALRGGRRGVADLVPGGFTIPENPFSGVTSSVADNGAAMRSAYPAAYALAA